MRQEEGCGIMNSATEIFVPLLSIFVGTLIASHCRYFSPTAHFTTIPSRSFYCLLELQFHLGSVQSLHYFTRQYIK